MKNRGIILAISACLMFLGVSSEASAKALYSYSDLFEEIVEIVEEHFYDSVRINQDFPAIKNTYRKKLPQVSTRKAFSALVNAMLRELNASHTYYLTPEDYEYFHLSALFSESPDIGALFQDQDLLYPTVGIMTQSFKERVYVVSVFSESIAEKAGLLKGDEILSVNGNPYTPIASLRPLVGTDVSFEIRRKEQAEPFKIVMKPVLVNPKQEMLDAQKASIRIIERAGNHIGYIHIYSYAGDEYHKGLLDAIAWGALKKADALIIDLRYGLGGAWPYYLNIFNRNIPTIETIDRDGRKSTVDSQWRKPAVYLVNAFSRSGKELLAFGAKNYPMVTVIGERTPGKTLGGRLFPLSNNDMLFLAVQSFRIDGVNLEGVGVAPDIEVPFDIRYCSGHDLQLEKAVEYLVDELSNENKRAK
ncbi:peptidase S41 [Prosthecochloris marina]|uniref:Peptidase S41 n=1 Tax=Prosthecochloris marina TaxID=2017681 RepID=A0A317TA22_9CHLB|nr:S41 family peptidase [Prosthecochloris marina]PWW83310.1 peptidase S41 [Prosthecochloris marina]